MISGLGSDLIEIERIAESLERFGDKFLQRHFTDREIAYCKKYANPTPHLAGRFSAKEAVVKALGTGIQSTVFWHDIEIINNPLGKPEVFLSDSLKKQFGEIEILVSISHCKAYASATAIVIRNGII